MTATNYFGLLCYKLLLPLGLYSDDTYDVDVMFIYVTVYDMNISRYYHY